MQRFAAFITAVLLIALGVLAAPTASAAPLPADYSAGAAADAMNFDLDIADGLDLADVRLISTDSASGSTLTPRSSSSASDLAVAVDGLELEVDSDQQIAPPDQGGPETGTLAAGSVPGLLSVGALDTSVEAHYATDASCVAGDLLADSQIETAAAGASVEPSDMASILSTGSISTRSITELVPTVGLNRAVRATASGTLPDASFLGGQVDVAVDGRPDLVGTATGVAGGATVDYNPGTVTVTVEGNETVLPAGASQTFDVAAGAVTITVNQPDVTETANGQSAAGTVVVYTAEVRVGTVGAPVATARFDFLPLRVSVIAPPGGIDCPPPAPVVVDPADASTTEDLTPTCTGTGFPGASLNLRVDDEPVDEVILVDGDGNWEFTPTAALALGDHTVSATQTVAGAVSGPSNENTFTVVDLTAPDAPVISQPVDGSTITDSTPDIVGIGEPDATVTVSIDGTEIGEAVVDEDGNWTVPVTTPLADGPHTASAIQTDEAGNESAADDVEFTLDDTVAPDAPVITAPAEGSTTNTTPDIVGTGEPGATVTVSIDGTEIGETTVDAEGNWTLPVTTPLAEGPHTASATQTDLAGNQSAADDVDFIVDAEAVLITAPADGSIIPEATPNIVGSGEPGATVVVSIDGAEIGEATVDEDGNWAVPVTTPLTDGPHIARAVQTDSDGNESTNEIEFAVDTVAPDAPVITEPADGSTTPDSTPDIVGTGEPNSTVTVFIDGVLIGEAVVDDDGNWTVPVTTPLANGPHSVSAVLTDGAGNESEVAFADFTVSAAAPGGEETDNENAVDNGPGSGGGESLASTGGPAVGASILGVLCLAAGGALVLIRSRRPGRSS